MAADAAAPDGADDGNGTAETEPAAEPTAEPTAEPGPEPPELAPEPVERAEPIRSDDAQPPHATATATIAVTISTGRRTAASRRM